MEIQNVKDIVRWRPYKLKVILTFNRKLQLERIIFYRNLQFLKILKINAHFLRE